MGNLTDSALLELAVKADIPSGYLASLALDQEHIKWIGKLCQLVHTRALEEDSNRSLVNKPTVQQLMDLVRKFRSAPGTDYDAPYRELQDAIYSALYPVSTYVPPERPRSFLCTKCGHTEPTTAAMLEHPQCKCGYLGFVVPGSYTEEHLIAAYNAGVKARQEPDIIKNAGRYMKLRAVGGKVWHLVNVQKENRLAVNEHYDAAVDAEFNI